MGFILRGQNGSWQRLRRVKAGHISPAFPASRNAVSHVSSAKHNELFGYGALSCPYCPLKKDRWTELKLRLNGGNCTGISPEETKQWGDKGSTAKGINSGMGTRGEWEERIA